MAIQENIKTGKQFFITKTINGVKTKIIYSFWRKAEVIEFNDEKNLEDKIGNVKGITNDVNQTQGYIADVTLIKAIKKQIIDSITNVTTLANTINKRLGGIRFYEENGKKYAVGSNGIPQRIA